MHARCERALQRADVPKDGERSWYACAFASASEWRIRIAGVCNLSNPERNPILRHVVVCIAAFVRSATGAPSSPDHGTAIAALLVGRADSAAPGLLPGARLIAIDAFQQVGNRERTDLDLLDDA